MSAAFTFPITRIGEADWVAKLQQYLASYDIDYLGVTSQELAACETRLGAALPESMRAYYLAFGGTQSSDFMYGLLPLAEVAPLDSAGFEFISLYFTPPEVAGLAYFADSPGNDPLCVDQDTGELYLFSHDPVRKAKVFADFNQYLLSEIMQLEDLLGEGLPEERAQQLAADYLAASGIDYDFRTQKL